MLQIKENISILPYNTFKINAQAKYFVQIHTEEDTIELLQNPVCKNNKKYILWEGSNSLFTKDFDGIVIQNNIKWKEIIEDTDTEVVVKVGAGENRNEYIEWTVFDKWRHGGENLILIPWTVGASPVQNIGAYGVEAKDSIIKVEGYNIETHKKELLDKSQCKFWYRDSIFKNAYAEKFIVTYVYFRLHKKGYVPKIGYGDIQKTLEKNVGNKETYTVQEVAKSIKEIRESKLPDTKKIGTAGSFFKNPIVSEKDFMYIQKIHPEVQWHKIDSSNDIKLSAGQLIDLTVGKWFQLGNAGTYEHHALVLVNLGSATGKEIVELATYIQKKIFETFGITLEPEVNYI